MKKRIRYIFILMTACILGILSVQGYWLYNAWHIALDQFGRSINDALGESAGKQGFHDIRVFLREHAPEGLTLDSLSDEATRRSYFFRRNSLRETPMPGAESPRGNTDTTNDRNEEEVTRPGNPSMYFISERLSREPYSLSSLDSLYLEELDSRGIKAVYTLDTFRVSRSAFRDRTFREQWRRHSELQTRKIRVNPIGDLYVQASFHTPYGYLFGKLIWILIASLVLFILTTWCFIYMLHTILKQKKWSEIKTDFINNMTHELKTPIATVNAAIDALRHYSGMDDKEKAGSYLDISHNELQRLSNLVEKVLQASIEGNEEPVLHKEKINIVDAIQDIIDSQELKAGKAVRFRLHNHLEDPLLRVDKLHFANMISNLVDNAIKYSREKVDIDISLRKKGAQTQIAIKDNGVGIPSHYQRLIFDKFFRVPSGDIHNVKGFGLGLNYVKSITEKHGGGIQVKSDPGKGTEFIISLPG